MTDEIQKKIAKQSRTRITPKQILIILRINENSNNSVFKTSNIYNAKALIRRQALESLTLIQALLQNLYRLKWHCEYLKNYLDRVIHLFFIKNIFKQMLKINWEMLIINCIYKINRYKLSLLVITGMIALNTNFYITFAFILNKTTKNYVWVLKQL